MDDERFDPALFGLWPERPVHGAWPPFPEGSAPEVKAVELPDGAELRLLLNDMTLEMRGQFDAFRALREASTLLVADSDDAAGKQARADLKAAADAMSLIIRTLEKIDALQRQMARDRDADAERNAEPPGYDDAKAHFLALVETRAEERARALFADWLRNGAALADGTAAASREDAGAASG